MTKKILVTLMLSLMSLPALAEEKTIEIVTNENSCEDGFICMEANVDGEVRRLTVDGTMMSYTTPSAEMGSIRMYLMKTNPCGKQEQAFGVVKKLYVNEQAGTWSEDPETAKAEGVCESVPMS